VSIRLQHANGDSESRDFMDATTRAKTTQSFNKRRNVTLTKTLTAGTPAASPVLPSLPANHVPLYAVLVPAGHSGVFGFAELWDFRMPLGSYTVDVYTRDEYARGAIMSSSGSETQSAGAYGAIASTSGALTIDHVPRVGDPNASRLVAVSAVIGDGCGSSNFDLRRFNPNNYGQAAVAISTFNAGHAPDPALRGNPANPATEWRSYQLTMGTSIAGMPVWGTGYPCGYAAAGERQANGTDNTFSRLGLRWTAGAAAARLSMVRFHFRGGL
jgi:hypothetical protein